MKHSIPSLCNTLLTRSSPPGPVARVRLHSCAPLPPGSSMQACSVSGPPLPTLYAVLTSPVGPYTTQFMVYAASLASLLPPFASPDGNAAAAVRIGHSACDILSASAAIPSADLNDFGAGGGWVQVLRLKTFVSGEMISEAQGSLRQQAVSDVVVATSGAVVTTSSAAIAQLLQVHSIISNPTTGMLLCRDGCCM